MITTFDQFELAPALLRGVALLGFTEPTPVQAHAIPLLLAGRDAIVQAKTGSGKTLAFGLPLLSLLAPRPRPQALVVLPTRELAIQVCAAIASVDPQSPLRLTALYGGVGLGPQEAALRRGVDVVVGTPGRLKDLLGRGSLDLGQVRILVLDEADEMLDHGFRRDIEYLMDRMPGRQQTLIFSATMPEAIEAIARRHLKDPVKVELTKSQITPSEISHGYVRVPTARRLDALVSLLRSEDPERALIFTRTKRETKKLALQLEKVAGIEAGFLNGNMSQNARNTMMARFRAGDFRFLVATDVAARGLDIEGLSHVFHVAVPTVVETYIHRSGRTGRAGQFGKTIILVTPEEESDFKAITKRIALTAVPLDLASLPALAPMAAPEPIARNHQGLSRSPVARPPAPRQGRPALRLDGSRAEGPRPATPRPDAPRPSANLAGAWRRFRMPLEAGHTQTAEDFLRWLSQQTRVARHSLRDVQVYRDHATFEVDGPEVARFMQRLTVINKR